MQPFQWKTFIAQFAALSRRQRLAGSRTLTGPALASSTVIGIHLTCEGGVKRRFFLHKREKRHTCFYKLLNLNTNITWYKFCFKGV